MKLGTIVAGAVVATLTFTAAPHASAGAQVDQVKASKTSYIATLSQYQNCITVKSAKDRYSPIFSGCYDWHSAVHAHWARYAASAMTGNMTYANTAATTLKSSLFTSELSYMQNTSVKNFTDNPYGFVWFLRLAREREQLTGDASLRPLASYAAQEALKFRYASVTTAEYRNSSFIALQLWEWASFTQDFAMQAQIKAYVDANIRPANCSLSSDAASTGFFAPCAMRLAAIASIDGPASAAWVNQQAQGYTAPYRTSFPNVHTKAQNFTNAYALATAGRIANNEALKENAASLVNKQMPNRTTYGAAYDVTHWVPQMGMLAIQAVTAS